MSVELHLPDLPDVPISVGAPAAPAAPRPPMPWPLRLRDALAAWLPLVVMALLAFVSWWLVTNAPQPLQPPEPRTPSYEPDYTMASFVLQRFAADGTLKLRIEGAQLRHIPATDRIEIDGVRLRTVAADGRVTAAQARRAVGAGDGSELQLIGGAEVTSSDALGRPIAMRGEFLHAFIDAERVRSHLPVQVRQGGTELRAAAFDYDKGANRLQLKGPLRATLPPRVAP